MKLTLNKFHVQDIQFAEASSFCHGVLYINKTECQYFPSMFFEKTQNIRRRSDWSVFSTYPDLLNRH